MTLAFPVFFDRLNGESFTNFPTSEPFSYFTIANRIEVSTHRNIDSFYGCFLIRLISAVIDLFCFSGLCAKISIQEGESVLYFYVSEFLFVSNLASLVKT